MEELLLLHGALGSKAQFAELEAALSHKFKVHTLDFSGHGRRPSHHHSFTIQNFSHEVLDWMNNKYIHDIHIFGYSMGGYVALWLARFYPGRVKKIFTLGTKLNWNEREAEREIGLLNAEKVAEKVPAFARALSDRHGEHEWKSVMSKTALLMKDLAHNHLGDTDLSKIGNQIMLGRGSLDTSVTFEETDHAHRLLKNSMLRNYSDVPHPIEKVPKDLLLTEIEHFFLAHHKERAVKK